MFIIVKLNGNKKNYKKAFLMKTELHICIKTSASLVFIMAVAHTTAARYSYEWAWFCSPSYRARLCKKCGMCPAQRKHLCNKTGAHIDTRAAVKTLFQCSSYCKCQNNYNNKLYRTYSNAEDRCYLLLLVATVTRSG